MVEFIEKKKALDEIDEWIEDQNENNIALNLARKYVNMIPAADVVPRKLFNECRNELCLKCGAYVNRHVGACDDCKWRPDNEL